MEFCGRLHILAVLAPENEPTVRTEKGHRTGLDIFEKIKTLAPAGIRIPDLSVRRLVTVPTAFRVF